MGNFVFEYIQHDKYNGFLLWLSSESIIDHLGEIEDLLKIFAFSGTFVIDQFFLTGNSENRFLCCEFSEGGVVFKEACPESSTDFFRRETVRFLHEDYEHVENSILTKELRGKIKNNIPF